MTTESVNYTELQERVHALCQAEGWQKDWANGGCYIHLEVSEFIEALRGKGSDPVEEAGDVLFTLLAVLSHYDIPFDDCARVLIQKMGKRDA